MTTLDNIWAGDKLQRRDEARLLERFLTSEARALVEMGREQAFVLALDAQYGEGKSWFLSRFRDQLRQNHPVAFVDAWIDDANSEPLVSIMAALEDELKPFLKSETVQEKFGAMARAALPIMGKGFVAAGGKLLTKYVGDQFGEDVQEAVDAAKKVASKEGEEDGPIDAALEAVVDGVSEIVDNAGKALLEQYRSRQRSRSAFRKNLRQLAASIDATDVDRRQSPIFVIIDELDRCRPSYAISLLEDIKHLFDVPGIVFVIALHGQQLTKSIEAVYGTRFDATAYLRRFFTRHYELRRLKLIELVATQFDDVPYTPRTFNSPQTWSARGKIESLSPAMIAGLLLTEWQATPREVQSVMDALRLFVSQWDYDLVPIELPFVLALLLNLVRGADIIPSIATIGPREVVFVTPADYASGNGGPGKIGAEALFEAYAMGAANSLPQIVQNNYEVGALGYMAQQLEAEYLSRFKGASPSGEQAPKSVWSEYAQRVKELGKFLDPISEDED